MSQEHVDEFVVPEPEPYVPGPMRVIENQDCVKIDAVWMTAERYADTYIKPSLKTETAKEIFAAILSRQIKYARTIGRRWSHVYVSADGQEWSLEKGEDTAALAALFAMVTYHEYPGTVDELSVLYPLEADMDVPNQTWLWGAEASHWYIWVE